MSLTTTILVVENDRAIRELLVECLTEEGYHTRSASTGRAGLAALVRDEPALTLFDMALPDLSATELIDQLQAMGLTDAPLVLMSTGRHDLEPLLAPGSLAFLVKPFQLDTLLALVAEHAAP